MHLYFMRRKTTIPQHEISLRLIITKPAPDTVSRDTDVLTTILERGYSFDKYLSIDSIGAERPKETVKFRVELTRGVSKLELYYFIRQRLCGKTLQELGTHSEDLASIMEAAEDANMISLTHVR